MNKFEVNWFNRSYVLLSIEEVMECDVNVIGEYMEELKGCVNEEEGKELIESIEFMNKSNYELVRLKEKIFGMGWNDKIEVDKGDEIIERVLENLREVCNSIVESL